MHAVACVYHARMLAACNSLKLASLQLLKLATDPPAVSVATTIKGVAYSAGFEDTNSYPPYGLYTDTSVPGTSPQEVEPQVAPTSAPAGCNVFNQFGIANYSGSIPCETNTSAPCVV